MDPRVDRRKNEPDPDDELSPEVLALLDSCGGRIRATDRAAVETARARMSGRQKDARDGSDRRAGDRRQNAASDLGNAA